MAGKIFARIGDIKGESRDVRHKDEIDVLSWSWGVTQSVASGRDGGGRAGKATFTDLTFVHSFDKARPFCSGLAQPERIFQTLFLPYEKRAGASRNFWS